MARQSIPLTLQLEVAEMFWDYMNKTKTKPETRAELQKLYLNDYCPLLELLPDECVEFDSVLSCMQNVGLLVKYEVSPWEQGSEYIVYQELEEHQVGTYNAQLSASCNIQELPPPNTQKKTSIKPMKLEYQNGKGGDFDDTVQLREKLTPKSFYWKRSMKVEESVKIFPESNENGVIDLDVISNEKLKLFKLHVRNESGRKLVFGYSVLGSASGFVDSINYEIRVETVGTDLDGFGSISVSVEISASNPGTLYVPLEFWFVCDTGETFRIVKFIKAEIICSGKTVGTVNLVKEKEDTDTRLSVVAACNNQDTSSQNEEKTLRKVKMLKCLNRKEEKNLDTERCSNMEWQNLSSVQEQKQKSQKENKKDLGNLVKLRKMLEVQSFRWEHSVKEKGNVKIFPKSNENGVIDLGAISNDELKRFSLYVNNESDRKLTCGYFVLQSARSIAIDTVDYKVKDKTVATELNGFCNVPVPVEISARNPGTLYVPLAFWFECDTEETFYIVKFIKAEITRMKQEYKFDLIDLRKKLLTQRHHLAKDKGNITILPSSNKDGVINVGTVGMTRYKAFQLHVSNNCANTYLFGYVVLGLESDFHVDERDFKVINEKVGNALSSFETIPVQVETELRNPGVVYVMLVFWFECSESEPFEIVKVIRADVMEKLVSDMQPVSPRVRLRPKPRPRPRNSKTKAKLIQGQPLFPTIPFPERLKSYDVPKVLTIHVRNRNLDGHLTKTVDGDLTALNHHARFSNMLHVEEIQMNKDIQRYDMEKTKLRKVSKQYLALAVPGLAENRPSLICGDRLFVRKLKRDGTAEENKEYEGFVHRVENNDVHLKFCAEFHESFVKNMSFSVRVTFSRTPLRLMHRAVEKASYFLSQLPAKEDPPNFAFALANTKRLHLYDRNIGNNNEQKQAVENIVFGNSLPYPYLVFGGPGSGKTNTMVEAIKQVLKNIPESKVLACAPSNSAADLILQRVSQHNPVPHSQMIRLNAYGRDVSSVNPELMEFCRRSCDGFFCFPSKEEIMSKYRLIVITLITAGRLVSMGIGKSHFTHVFIDEAGHAMEPECLIPIIGLHKMNRKGRKVVLAGDPKQLGPVIRSPEAIKFGLGVSFLERLMGPQFRCYNRKPCNEPDHVGRYDEKFVTKLLNNYRSHPAIIKLPNEMFYENELRACADQPLRESLCQWNGLRKKGFPVVFEGVCGKDQREERSPSFFNLQEVSVVLRYVKDLKEARGITVKTEEIGIISPYHRQVQKIRESMKKKSLDIRDIKVGSVEEFQGQERKVIIVSAVRSSEEFLHIDATHKLGFLRNPKRFNVAITRAKALLIVIGNPHILCRDKHWRRFIQYCMDNGSYKGCAFQMPDIDDKNLVTQLAYLDLVNEGAHCGDKGLLTSTDFEDQEWKPGEE